MPSAALSRTGSLRSMYDTKPSTSDIRRPASSTALRMAMQASWNSVSGAFAAGVVRRLADAGDDGRATILHQSVEDALRR